MTTASLTFSNGKCVEAHAPVSRPYFKLMDASGSLHSGDPSREGIEARRASLIAENELRADLVRCGFHASLKYPMPPRQKMAVIRSHRNHLAIIKAEINYWKKADAEEVQI